MQTDTQKRLGIVALVIVASLALVALSHFIPLVNSTRPPFIDLNGSVANAWLYLSHTGGKHGAPWFAIACLIATLSLSKLSYQQQIKNALIIVASVALFAGGGAFFNEHAIKENLQIPRPNIKALSTDLGNGHLGENTAQFYQRGDKSARSAYLANALAQPIPTMALSPKINAHWVEETGYSFPSGHSYTVFFFATYFLLFAALNLRTWWPFFVLSPWAVAVCYSRSLLVLHTPTDITVGAIQGTLMAALAVAATHKWLCRTPL